MIVTRDLLPRDWSWRPGSACTMHIALEKSGEVMVVGEIVWSQRTEAGMDILGVRFIDNPPESLQSVERFVLQRLHVGLRVESQRQTPDEAESLQLTVPLETELHEHGREGEPCRLEIHTIKGRMLHARYAYKEGEEKRRPPAECLADLTVLPPLWARSEKRALRFAVSVAQVDDDGVVMEFSAAAGDLQAMIVDLIPPAIVRARKPSEVDVSWVLLILFLLLIVLVISSMS